MAKYVKKGQIDLYGKQKTHWLVWVGWACFALVILSALSN
jgi:hypothetical protein